MLQLIGILTRANNEITEDGTLINTVLFYFHPELQAVFMNVVKPYAVV